MFGCFCSIAVVLWHQAKYDETVKLCRENLAVFEACRGRDHPSVLTTNALIADAQKRQAAGALIPVGAPVHIGGLVNRPELNGQQGVVLHFDRAKARYGVQLADGREMLLKPECIKHT